MVKKKSRLRGTEFAPRGVAASSRTEQHRRAMANPEYREKIRSRDRERNERRFADQNWKAAAYAVRAIKYLQRGGVQGFPEARKQARLRAREADKERMRTDPRRMELEKLSRARRGQRQNQRRKDARRMAKDAARLAELTGVTEATPLHPDFVWQAKVAAKRNAGGK